MKRITAVILSLITTLSATAVNAAAVDAFDTAQYIIENVQNPTVSSIGGEWSVIGLARSGAEVPEGYFGKYYENLENYVKAQNGVLSARKYTEYSRVVLAVTAIGKNPRDVAGYDLTAPLADTETAVKQGINGAVWALIALDSGKYGGEKEREFYIDYILSAEKENGGWALSKNSAEPEPDITAMALTALAAYTDDEDVHGAVERGVNALSDMQSADGGFYAYGAETSESTAQAIMALSSLGIPLTDERFVKNGHSLLDSLYSFKIDGGSFAHIEGSDLMATEQCFYALTALKRAEEGQSALFDMADLLTVEPSVRIIFPAQCFTDGNYRSLAEYMYKTRK